MSQHCECEQRESVKMPVNGLCLDVDPSLLGCLTREEIIELIREETQGAGSGVIPHFEIGVETLYPAIYRGKQVYAQLVDFGALPNKSTKTIQHGISDVEWIVLSEHLSRVEDSYYRPMTLASPTSAPNDWHYYYSKTEFGITTGIDRRSSSAVICFLYTKTTDPVIG